MGGKKKPVPDGETYLTVKQTMMKIGNISGKSITQDKLREDAPWGSG